MKKIKISLSFTIVILFCVTQVVWSALTFGAATSDRVDCGTLNSLNPSAWTAMAWVFPTTLTGNRMFFSKAGSSSPFDRFTFGISPGTLDEMRVVHTRATTDLDYRSTGADITTNKWWFVVAVLDQGAASGEIVKFYIGDLSTLAVQTSLGTATDGSGAFDDISPNALKIGNTGANDGAFQGRIASAIFVDSGLTLDQIRAWQFRPRNIAGAKVYMQLGFNGTGTQPDWTGNGNNGTLTGTSVSDHVPLGLPF